MAGGYFVELRERDVVPLRNGDIQQRPGLVQRRYDYLQVPLAVVIAFAREESAVEVSAVVVDGAAAAASARHADAGAPRPLHVALRPRVLVPSDHHTRAVRPQQQGAVVLRSSRVQPILERQVGVDVAGRRHVHPSRFTGRGGRAAPLLATARGSTSHSPVRV